MKFLPLLLLFSAVRAAIAQPPIATWPLAPVPPGGNSAAIAAPRQEWIVEVMKKADAIKAANLESPVQLIFDGDSITDLWKNTGREIWDARYAPLHAANFGVGADRTQNLLWRLQAGQVEGLDPRLVVLLIGSNNLLGNTPDEIARAIAEIVTQYEKLCPRAKILLIGLLPRAASPADGFRAKIKEVNGQIARLASDKRVIYLDIGDKFLETDGTLSKALMPDFLHPSAQGYQIWADAIQPVIDSIFTPAGGAKSASP